VRAHRVRSSTLAGAGFTVCAGVPGVSASDKLKPRTLKDVALAEDLLTWIILVG